MKMAVFWVVAPCVRETSVNFCQTTRHNNPEDRHLQPINCLKSSLEMQDIISSVAEMIVLSFQDTKGEQALTFSSA
jgi:hypothetical protein